MAAVRECNFRTGRILGKRFPEAQVHTVHRTSAAGTSPMDSMDECFRKTLSRNSPRAEVAFSISFHSFNMKVRKIHQFFEKSEKIRKFMKIWKNQKICENL